MGQFVIAFSFIVVVLQATTMLLHRPASSWSFSLVERPALVGSQDITEVLAAWNPHALLLLCPWVDLAMLGAQPVIDDPMLSVAGLRDAGVRWAGIGSSPTSPLVSPLFGAMAGLPPCALFVARRDLLGPQGVQLAAALGAAGVRVRLRLGEHKLHVWPVIEIEAGLPEADEAVADMAEAVREMLAPAPASAASG